MIGSFFQIAYPREPDCRKSRRLAVSIGPVAGLKCGVSLPQQSSCFRFVIAAIALGFNLMNEATKLLRVFMMAVSLLVFRSSICYFVRSITVRTRLPINQQMNQSLAMDRVRRRHRFGCPTAERNLAPKLLSNCSQTAPKLLLNRSLTN